MGREVKARGRPSRDARDDRLLEACLRSISSGLLFASLCFWCSESERGRERERVRGRKIDKDVVWCTFPGWWVLVRRNWFGTGMEEADGEAEAGYGGCFPELGRLHLYNPKHKAAVHARGGESVCCEH